MVLKQNKTKKKKKKRKFLSIILYHFSFGKNKAYQLIIALILRTLPIN